MITDNQKKLLIQQYYDRGVLKKEIRSYEVSLWTLQDEFITVLKWSDVEQKGRIESPKMTLNIDGTEKFSFSIPMYYREDGKLVENPNWYNTQNGNLMVGMRKLKVIFNKDNPEIDNDVDWRSLFNKIYVPADYNGNVNLFNRPIVPASKFIEAGWDEFNGAYGTLYSSSNSYIIGGKEYDVIYTPISTNGSVMAPPALTTYINSVMSSGSTIQDKLDYDASHSKLLLGIYEANSDHHEKWTEELHEMQAEWDIIRAKNELFGYNSNPDNIEFGESSDYYYYQKYLRSINTFEFIITNVTETHEKDMLTCAIESEGLAFQELGKIGYKVSLSLANFELVYKEWETNGTEAAAEPIQNIQYWCEEAGLEPVPSDPALINSRVWYYDIQMNWDAFADGKQRDPHVVYEEEYTNSWDNDLRPLTFESFREKARTIEVEKSNLYNITKTIAEKFEVFCKYEYMYDENYHIIGRKVVFYNNFMQDGLGSITLQYPYSSSKISRTMDSTAITTKLFVLDVDEHSITDAEPNASREDYILNFDFLHQKGAITQEQYDAIQPYYKDVRAKNDELINLQNQLIIYQEQQPEIAAKKTVLDNSVKIDEEQKKANSRLGDALGASDGVADKYIELSAANPDYLLIHTGENGSRYVNLSTTNKGIVDDSITVWTTFGYDSNDKPQLSNQITGFILDHDGANNLTTLTFTQDTSAYTNVYLLYKYDPKLYYDNVIKIWETKQAQDELDLSEQAKLLDDINEKIDSTTSEIQRVLREKEQIVKAFEHLMGPALREGYWQPEDYDDYGDRKISNISLSTSVDLTESTGKEMKAGWDSDLFTGEQKLYYEEGVNKDKIYYPCINLNSLFGANIPTDLSDYSIVWKATNKENYSYDWTSIKDLRVLSIGSSALIRFINYGNEGIIPVLVVTGAQAFTPEELTRLTETGEARLEKYSVSVDKTSGATSVSHGDNQITIGNNWIIINKNTDETTYPIVQPRIKNSAMTLKTDTNSLFIKYGDNILSQFSDYYINTRIGNQGGPEYYITIKPEVLIKYGLGQNFNINYILSNANTAIYLDARKVSQENAYPKVSYSIDVNLLNTSLIHTLYSKLARIVMVNDTDLKFENTFGYISQVDLDLDNCQNDTVEIKNYKTKFEDLFSTIVAQTEEMKRSGAGLTTALSGGIPLSEDGFTQTIIQHKSILDAYLDSHFDSSQVVKDRLTELFSEAGDILGGANKTLNKLKSLTLDNAGILSRFAENVAVELTTKVYHSTEKPASFKPGDIWIYTDEYGNEHRYLAMTDSSLSGSGSDFGFVRTHDGSLASIRGANVVWDAEAGTVDITGENEINIKSGKNLYLAANADVNIVGNKSVNIGGSTINIGAGIGPAHFTVSGSINTTKFKNKTNNELGSFWFRYKDGHWTYKNNEVDLTDYGITIAVKENQSLVNDVDQLFVWNRGNDDITWMESNNNTMGSINLVASGITQIEEGKANTKLSKVLINPYRIEMGAAELELKAASQMNFITSQGATNNTSAVHISSEDGIWIGTGTTQGVRIFGGEVKLNDDGTIDTNITKAAGASIELNSEHLILGYANTKTNSATAIEMNEKFVIIAAGDQITGDTATDDNKSITGTTGGLIGAKFTNSSIGFATGSGDNINAILMNEKGITIGSGSVNVTLPTTSNDNNNLRASKGSYTRISDEGIELGSLADLYVNTDNFKLQTHSREKGDANSEFEDGETILAVGSNLQSINYSTTIKDGKFYNNNTEITGTDVKFLLNKNGAYFKGTVYAAAGSFTGAITASSFILNDSNGYKLDITYAISVGITQPADENFTYTTRPNKTNISSYITTNSISEDNQKLLYIWTKITTTVGGQSRSTYAMEHVNADGTTDTVKVDYAVNKTAAVPTGSVTWYDKIANAEEQISKAYPFLITRTQIFQNHAWVTSYDFSKLIDDDQSYVQAVRTLYWLKNNTNPTTISTEVTSTTDEVDQWTLVVPTYTGTAAAPQIYYTCVQTKWANPTKCTWTTAVQDYGLTIANQHATEASKAAADAATSVGPITIYGLEKDVTWNGTTYALALGNNKTAPMLIGSNGGVTIVDTNIAAGTAGYGSAIVLKGGGIGMHGSTINFTTADATTTNAISINSSGITMGTTGNITLLSNNIILNSTATGTDSLFELKKKASDQTEQNNKYDTAMKYSITNGLEITGKITATSFTLGSTSIPSDLMGSDGKINSNYYNSGGSTYNYTYSTDGMGWFEWPEDSGNWYVSLTSKNHDDTSNVQGVLIGYSETSGVTQHLIVPYSASSSKKMVDISRNGIYFDTNTEEGWIGDQAGSTHAGSWEPSDGRKKYKLSSDNSYYTGGWLYNDNHWYYIGADGYMYTGIHTIDNSKYYFNTSGAYESNHIYLDNDGIDVIGNRISVNGKEVWARDDIIVLKNGDDESDIINEMRAKGATDWVMIKPYYNAFVTAEINDGKTYKNAVGAKTTPWDSIQKQPLTFVSGERTLADNAGSYEYNVSIDIVVEEAVQCTSGGIRISNSKTYVDIDISGPTLTDNVVTWTGHRTLSGSAAINLCQPGEILYVQVYADQASYQSFSKVTVECATNYSIGRVPCSVYYFP